MTTLTLTIDTWLDAYGEPDENRRTELIERVWAPTGRLVDPPFEGTGREQIHALAAAAQQQFPGHRFRRTSGIDAHHRYARYTWELLDPRGSIAAAGLDVAQVDEDGKLLQVAGFFGEVPALTP